MQRRKLFKYPFDSATTKKANAKTAFIWNWIDQMFPERQTAM